MVNKKYKTLIVTQARIGSSRLPSKILKNILDETILSIHLKRLKQVRLCNKIIVATTFEKGVDKILKIVNDSGFDYYQGSTNNVLKRFYNAAKLYKPDYIIRVTSDCPLIDPKLIDKVIAFTIDRKLDYGSNVLIENYPDGQDIEVFTFNALKIAYESAKLDSEKEHVTPYIINHSTFKEGNEFKAEDFPSSKDYSKVRMTVDELADYKAIETLSKHIGLNSDWLTYTNFILNNPELFTNQKIIRNEGSKT